MSMMVSFCAVLFPRGVLDEILNLIESVSGVFLPIFSMSCYTISSPMSLSLKKQMKLCLTQQENILDIENRNCML